MTNEPRKEATDAAIKAHADLIERSAEMLCPEHGEIYQLRPIEGFALKIDPDAEPFTFLNWSDLNHRPHVEPIATISITITPEMWERILSNR